MPFATLRFTLPEEQDDFHSAISGGMAKSVLWEIDQRCRSLVKYGEPTDEARRLAEEIRELIPATLLKE